MSNVKKEIAGLVARKVKITDVQAEMAVDVVLEFVKKKLPPTVAGQFDSILEGKLNVADAANLLGGLMGGKKK
jgi:hypothetical protein